MIPSVEWARSYKLRRIRFSHLYRNFIKTKVTELVNKMIVDKIQEKMREAGVSQKIWENVVVNSVVVNNNGIIINIHNEYYAESGFDVAKAREEGTEDHMIRPKDKQSLSWIVGGKRFFSGGHMVSGLPRLNIIQQVIEDTEYELQQKINDEFFIWKTLLFR